MDLYVNSGESQKKVAVEQTALIMDAVIGDPYQDSKLVTGAGNIALVTVGTRWNSQEVEKFSLLGFDEYWRCRLYLQLPEVLSAGQIDLRNNSFLQVLGQYNIEADRKIFLPAGGTFDVDSVTTGALFISIDAAYENREKQPLKFTGELKIDLPE